MKTGRLAQEPGEEPFELIALLGTGGFAHTYKANVLDEDLRDEFGAEIVALKIPLNKKKERILKREVETNAVLHLRLKDLKALNIVRYLGFEVFDGRMVMAMEFVSGGSLRDRLGKISRQKRVPVEDAVKIAEGVLKGLGAVHEEHIFHRDIKPENILMDGNTPKIADLGISRMLQAHELASTATGTLFYMSPEILGREGASFTSDIWSVGVTLYEMVTGRLPFGDIETPPGEMVDMIRRQDHAPAFEVCADVPQALSEIVDRSLRKNPKDRFASAEEMYQALKRFRKMPDDRLEAEMASIRAELASLAEWNTDTSEAKLRALVAKYPREPRAYQYLGEFYNRCERYAEAIEAFKKGIDLDEENALLYWDLALAYQRVGQRGPAAKSLQKAMALGLDTSLQRHAANLLKVLQSGGS